jgi:hypothetical protein
MGVEGEEEHDRSCRNLRARKNVNINLKLRSEGCGVVKKRTTFESVFFKRILPGKILFPRKMKIQFYL